MLLILSALVHDVLLHGATAIDTNHIFLNCAIAAGNVNMIAVLLPSHSNLRNQVIECDIEICKCDFNLGFFQLTQAFHDRLSIQSNHVL